MPLIQTLPLALGGIIVLLGLSTAIVAATRFWRWSRVVEDLRAEHPDIDPNVILQAARTAIYRRVAFRLNGASERDIGVLELGYSSIGKQAMDRVNAPRLLQKVPLTIGLGAAWIAFGVVGMEGVLDVIQSLRESLHI